MSARVLVTGCARSGTLYTARVLAACGLRCGHESVFGPAEHYEWGDFEADASWLAVPHLASLRHEDVLVVHQVRHPLACARSFLSFFDDEHVVEPWEPYRAAVRRFAPWVYASEDPVERFVTYWVTWNRHVEGYAAFGQRVEELDRTAMNSIFAASRREVAQETIASALEAFGKDVNCWPYGTPGITAAELRATKAGQLLDQLARSYGYDLDDR